MSVHIASRCIVGVCPDCRRVIAVTNNHETWPLIECVCGWVGSTTDFVERVRVTDQGVER